MRRTLLWVAAVIAALLLVIVAAMVIVLLSVSGGFRGHTFTGVALEQLFLLIVVCVGLGFAFAEAIRAARRG